MGNEPFFDKAGNTGLRHFRNAARFSLNGLRAAFTRESAFRQELAVLLVLTPLAVWLSKSMFDFISMMAVAGFVLVIELLNSSVEAAVDRSGTEHNELAGLAKDYGSAAVMIALVIAALVWLTFLYQRLVS